jgi:hypothetical protein
MHYLIFGKFTINQNILPNNVKVSLWDKKAMISMFAKKHKYHRMKDNTCVYDYNLNNVKMYRLDDQFEINGDIIMIDPNELREYNYYEEVIVNKTLINTIIEIQNKFKDTNIIIYLFPMLE